jgi:serine phosphatase RsbU (regulator of sigma subunit)
MAEGRREGTPDNLAAADNRLVSVAEVRSFHSKKALLTVSKTLRNRLQQSLWCRMCLAIWSSMTYIVFFSRARAKPGLLLQRMVFQEIDINTLVTGS